MLSIKTAARVIVWHVGNAAPQFTKDDGPVWNFQADGHELTYLLHIIHATSDDAYRIGVHGEALTERQGYTCSYCGAVNKAAYKGSCPKCPRTKAA